MSFELRLGYVLSLAELLQTLLIREALTSEQQFKFIDVILLTDLDTWAIIPLENQELFFPRMGKTHLCRSVFMIRGSGRKKGCGICSQWSIFFPGAVNNNGLHRVYLDLASDWFGL